MQPEVPRIQEVFSFQMGEMRSSTLALQCANEEGRKSSVVYMSLTSAMSKLLQDAAKYKNRDPAKYEIVVGVVVALNLIRRVLVCVQTD